MHYDALTKAEKALYFEGVSDTHWRRVTLRWFRRSDGSPVGSLTNVFLGGSIKGDETRTPVTVLDCSVLDEDHVLDWSHGAHRKFRVEIIDARFVAALNDWVDADAFTGPVWEFDRQGPLVQLTVEGPEMEAMGSVRKADTKRAKSLATAAIRDFLTSAGANASDLRIPRLKAKLPRDVTVTVRTGKDQNKRKDGYQGPKKRVMKVDRSDSYWAVSEDIADALDRDLFGNGAGQLVLATRKSRPSHTLDTRHLLSPVGETRASEGESPNVWIGLGANPKGPRERITERVELPKKHPASSFSQRWNGTKRERIEVIENKHWRKAADCLKALRRRRDKAMREQVQYEVEALPVIPWLRASSLVSVPTHGGRGAARAAQWDLPLGPGADPLRIGATRRAGWQR